MGTASVEDILTRRVEFPILSIMFEQWLAVWSMALEMLAACVPDCVPVTQQNEFPAHTLNRRAIVLAEVSDCLEVRCQVSRQPDPFKITQGLSFESTV